MRIWKTKKLVEELARDALSEREKVQDWVKRPVFSPVFANLITGYFFWRLWKTFFLLSKLIRDRPASTRPNHQQPINS